MKAAGCGRARCEASIVLRHSRGGGMQRLLTMVLLRPPLIALWMM